MYKNFNGMEYFTEYLIYRALTKINGDRDKNGETMYTASYMQKLHDSMERDIFKNPDGYRLTKGGSIGIILDSIVREEEKRRELQMELNALYDETLQDFKKLTGNDKKVMSNPNSEIPEKGVNALPLSPYHSKMKKRAAFLESGTSVLYADMNELFDKEGNFSVNADAELFKKSDLKKPHAKLFTDDDRSHLSAFMPYLTESQYKAVKPHINKIKEPMDPDRVKNPIAVLKYLKENGYEYDVLPDKYDGQIKAVVKNTGLSVRLTDEKRNQDYAGRIFANGKPCYYITDERVNPLDNTDHRKKSFRAGEKETVDLLKSVMGETVERSDGTPAGINREKPHKKGDTLNSVFYSKGAFTQDMGQYTGEDGKVHNYALYIKNETADFGVKRFYKPDNAKNALITYIENAKTSYKDLTGVNALLRDFEKNGENPDFSPVFSGDETISGLQKNYWNYLKGTEDLDTSGINTEDFTELPDKRMNVLNHLSMKADSEIGFYDDEKDILNINPLKTAEFMGEAGAFKNRETLINAFKMLPEESLNFTGDESYNDSVKDRLIVFDDKTAVPMMLHSSETARNMQKVFMETLISSGITVEDKDILIDEKGVMKYSGKKMTGVLNKGGVKNEKEIEGYVGQLFTPDGLGLYETKFASSENYNFVPGYNAHIVPFKDSDIEKTESVEERTRLLGYEEIMSRKIRQQIKEDLLTGGDVVGDPSSLNAMYKNKFPNTRFSIDFIEKAHLRNMSDELIEAKIKTASQKVRYSNDIKDNSTINADYRAKNDPYYKYKALNDNFYSDYDLTGRRNMSVLRSGDYFDDIATGSSTNQGVIRYLTDSSKVNPDGSITPGVPGDKTALMKMLKYSDFNAGDRQQMDFSNLEQASSIARARTYFASVGGHNFDDGHIVSKKFAEKHNIIAGGELRSLKIGDKMCSNGNKGVIPVVVDPDMDLKEAEEKGLKKAVEFLRENPDTDVICSPYSMITRFTGGIAREMMENDGYLDFIITDMPVDEKTKIYGGEDAQEGKGRKASSQLAWVLDAKGAEAVKDEFYGNNTKGILNTREYLITLGFDIDETGTIHKGYSPHQGEKRNIFEIPEPLYKNTRSGPKVDTAKMNDGFSKMIGDKGGFLEIPFDLKYPDGSPLQKKDPADKDSPYLLPIMSSHLRAGQEIYEDSFVMHDYTKNYVSVFESAVIAREALKAGDTAVYSEMHKKASENFKNITDDVIERKIEGKHNMVKEDIMSCRQPDSATAVWSADPALDIDTIGMSRKMAESLKLKDGDSTLIFRDPVLREGALRYMKIKTDENLTGVSINPLMDKSFDGDFDGGAGRSAVKSCSYAA